MSVLLETSKGDLVIDLYTDDCPNASKNFLKLCKIKYYNNCLFHYIVRDFLAQTGDPTGTGTGGDSINGVLYGEQARLFDDEIRPHLRHKKKGVVGMAGGGKNMNASQFYITTGVELDSLDDRHTVFGEVTEGKDVLKTINEAFVDDNHRPLQNIRIRHTIILDDPFPDPPQLEEHIPEGSPPPVFATEGDRLEDDWVPTEDTRDAAVIEEETRKLEAEKRAEVLEMVGDLPTADAKPPTNQIFVCKLNAVTTEEDLEIIFSRFGQVTACDIIRDWKTGDSLCYAFISFDTDEAAERAFFKMDNVLIDDRRIHVDFSQSMHHLWRQFKVSALRRKPLRSAPTARAFEAEGPGPTILTGCRPLGRQGRLLSEQRPPRRSTAAAGKSPLVSWSSSLERHEACMPGPPAGDVSGRGYELVYEKEQPPPSTSGRGDRNRPRERGHRERGREKLPENGSRHHRVGEWDGERQKRSRTRSRERERRRDASLPERHHDRRYRDEDRREITGDKFSEDRQHREKKKEKDKKDKHHKRQKDRG